VAASATHRRSFAVLAGIALAHVLLVAGCGSSTSAADADPVVFRASDGVRLRGLVSGAGRVGIVLSHMGRPGDSRADWQPLARALADKGYLVLAYSRRGACLANGTSCSAGVDDLPASWRDVVGAYRFLRARGAARVVLVGASIGAMSSLAAAQRDDVQVAAVIEIGGINDASGYSFTRRSLRRIEGAKLFASSAHDIYGGAEVARTWYAWARSPKQLAILAGGEHGTDLLKTARTRKRLVTLVERFVMTAAPPG
jgi:dipeptidyl aminopeptidase/acylaminoacyl peptidase